MRCDHMADLIADDALGLLQPAEGARLRRHIEAGCPGCAAELASLRETVAFLPGAQQAAEPSPEVRARLLETIRNEAARDRHAAQPEVRIEPTRTGGAWWRMAAAALLGAALAGGVASALVLRQEKTIASYRDMVETLDAQIYRQEEALASLERQIRDATASIQMVSAPGISVVDRAGKGTLASASARVFWDPLQGTWLLYGAKLPPPPAGRTYQLWLITADAKVSAGLFDAAAHSPAAGTVRLPEGAHAVAAAVTDEPAGGSPQPTGSILLLGKI